MTGLVRKSDFWEGIKLGNEWLVGSNDGWAHQNSKFLRKFQTHMPDMGGCVRTPSNGF